MVSVISLTKAKNRLAVLWFSGGGIILFVVILQSLLGHYGTRAADAFGWLLPTIMPTLSLVIGVLVADALGANPRRKDRINMFLYHLAFAISTAYLLAVALTIAVAPFAQASPLELMEMSNLFLGPLQGLTASALGAFFFKPDPL